MTVYKYIIFGIGAYRWPVQPRSIRIGCLSVVTFIALGALWGCRTPSTDWNGTWKLNPSKGKFQGPIITISISADGEYRYDDGSHSFTFRCDGKDRPTEKKDRTGTCVKSSPTMLDRIQKENGVKTNVGRWELSDGGKVLVMTGTSFRPTGTFVTGQIVATRMSGFSDFAGQWRDTSYLQRHSDLTLQLDSQTLHIGYPSAGQYIDAPLDGTDAPVLGPHAPQGVTYTAELNGRREILTLTKRNGKPSIQGSLELSADGKVITESWWSADQAGDKGTLVYERK